MNFLCKIFVFESTRRPVRLNTRIGQKESKRVFSSKFILVFFPTEDKATCTIQKAFFPLILIQRVPSAHVTLLYHSDPVP